MSAKSKAKAKKAAKAKQQPEVKNSDIVPCQIYLLTPPVISDLHAFCTLLEQALAVSPVACVQLRLKDMNGVPADDSAIVQAGFAIKPICHGHDTLLLVNDRPDLAEQIGADGAHIGQDDMDYFSSRELLGGDAIIGITCHNSKELAFEAASSGADYVAFGAFFETPTKTPKHRAELEILSWWHEAVEIPSVAIGGITVSNAAEVISAGADFIAVSSGVWDHPDGPAAAVSQFSALCLEHSRH
ncbi:thiamine phosphate synthase [Litorimonas sp. RW-G-Af-16]|uniref:thiamine phosphate synthase n=1 Tax=Litorimonas sp. RW-G-Af-16 TaxID=3241168 RepID=UPI00390CD8D0